MDNAAPVFHQTLWNFSFIILLCLFRARIRKLKMNYLWIYKIICDTATSPKCSDSKSRRAVVLVTSHDLRCEHLDSAATNLSFLCYFLQVTGTTINCDNGQFSEFGNDCIVRLF